LDQILLCALVNFLQEDAEDGATKYSLPGRARHFRYGINERIDACVRFRLVFSVLCVYADIAEDLLDLCLRLRVFAPVGGVEDRALGGGCAGKRSVDAPGTLVVHDVCADLANLFWCSGIVEVVVLDLEVLAEGKEDVKRELIELGIRLVLLLYGESAEEQRERDG